MSEECELASLRELIDLFDEVALCDLFGPVQIDSQNLGFIQGILKIPDRSKLDQSIHIPAHPFGRVPQIFIAAANSFHEVIYSKPFGAEKDLQALDLPFREDALSRSLQPLEEIIHRRLKNSFLDVLLDL